MKEQRFFYTPQPESGQLPDDEAQHAVRVLRLQMGDEIYLMDGHGTFHRATITEAGGHRCRYRILDSEPQQPEWTGHIHLAVAPTKNMDRMEWLAEKATEVGMDELSLLDCRFSERRVVKTERLDKILISAMKQSHKAWKPVLNEMTPFRRFITRPDLPPQRFIAHCYNPADIAANTPTVATVPATSSLTSPSVATMPAVPPLTSPSVAAVSATSPVIAATTAVSSPSAATVPAVPPLTSPSVAAVPEGYPSGHSPSSRLPFLLDLLCPRTSALVLIGPEGDFSIDEVREAEAAGFRSVSLGTSRLRTETAALVAVHLMRLACRVEG